MISLRFFISKTGILYPKCATNKVEWRRRNSNGNANVKTMKKIVEELMKILDIDRHYTVKPKTKLHLLTYLPKTQEELPVRTMKDSFDIALIPLASDTKLQNKYVSYLEDVRIGRLMEDIDMFAVWCCVKHLMDHENPEKPFPYIVVTILIDRINLLMRDFKPTGDVRLSGHVCWVGRSSIEVVVYVDQKEGGEWKRVTKALLLMAARNSLNTGPGLVNPIKAETPEEATLLKEGEKRRATRLQRMSDSLFKKVPSKEELTMIHSLFIKTISEEGDILGKRVLPPRSKWMTDGSINNLIFCHPENRNMYNKIFGGFLIRQAMELSWLTAFVFGMTPPRLIKISDIRFLKPVDVGSVVKLNASTTYSEGEFVQIFVFAEVYTTPSKEGKNTNSFYFTYHLGKPCDTIYPVTYLEAMKFIEGRRHFYDELNKPKSADTDES